MNSSRYSNKSTGLKYVPPNQRTTHNPLEKVSSPPSPAPARSSSSSPSPAPKQKPNDIFLSSTNFPVLASKSLPLSASISTPVVVKPKPSLDFKEIVEKSAHLPDPSTIVIPPIRDAGDSVDDEHVKYDLSAYVRLQERRQEEYDYLYGPGAFARDCLNYERYSSASESNSSSEEEEEDADEELMDY